jgi:hypothetical protein
MLSPLLFNLAFGSAFVSKVFAAAASKAGDEKR